MCVSVYISLFVQFAYECQVFKCACDCVVCVCAYIVHVYVGYMSELGGSKVVYQNVTVIITSK